MYSFAAGADWGGEAGGKLRSVLGQLDVVV